MKIQPRKIEKPWGYELIWAETDQYVGKILHVNAGEALSLQYHELKDETLFLLSGTMLLRVGPTVGELEEFTCTEGQAFRVKPRTIHAIEAITDCDVLEASTAHLDDVVRLKDRYGRAPE